MSCVECGSPAGSKFQLCRNCVEVRKDARDNRLEQLGFIETIHEPIALIEDLRFQLSGIVALSLMVGWYIYNSTPSTPQNFLPALMPASEALCWSFTALTWVVMWMRLLTQSATLAVTAIFFPPAVYKLLFTNWRETRLIFALHLGFLAASLILAFNPAIPQFLR